jgi:hypothetical protein
VAERRGWDLPPAERKKEWPSTACAHRFRLRVMTPGSSIAPRGHILNTPRRENVNDVFQGYCDLVFLDGCWSINLNRVYRKCSSIGSMNYLTLHFVPAIRR